MAMKRKAMAAVAALSLTAIMVAGTFAWVSLNSQRINEWRGEADPGTTDPDEVGPGATLHDDFTPNGTDKSIYVENWGNEDLLVRIRLSEYMELGEGAGGKSLSTDSSGQPVHNPANKAVPVVSGANIDKIDTWANHVPEDSDPAKNKLAPVFNTYWEWKTGGQKYYYPVSEADRGTDGFVDQSSPFDLTANSKRGDVSAQQTLGATVITMAEWKSGGSLPGPYWVMDTDGWAYWANALEPSQATGLLLNKVEPKAAPAEDYYYGVNVLGQMGTADATSGQAAGSSTSSGNLLGSYEDFGLAGNGGWTTDGKDLMDKIAGIIKDRPLPTPFPTVVPESPTPINTPIPTDTPTNTPIPTDAPEPEDPITPPIVEVTGGWMYGDVIFMKAGEEVSFKGISSDNFTVEKFGINGSSNHDVQSPLSLIVNDDDVTATMVFLTKAPIGSIETIDGLFEGERKVNSTTTRKETYNATQKLAVLVPENTINVYDYTTVFYLVYDNGIWQEFIKGDGVWIQGNEKELEVNPASMSAQSYSY